MAIAARPWAASRRSARPAPEWAAASTPKVTEAARAVSAAARSASRRRKPREPTSLPPQANAPGGRGEGQAVAPLAAAEQDGSRGRGPVRIELLAGRPGRRDQRDFTREGAGRLSRDPATLLAAEKRGPPGAVGGPVEGHRVLPLRGDRQPAGAAQRPQGEEGCLPGPPAVGQGPVADGREREKEGEEGGGRQRLHEGEARNGREAMTRIDGHAGRKGKERATLS